MWNWDAGAKIITDGWLSESMLTNSFLNMKAILVAAFNQEKALVGAFSVIMNLRVDLPTFVWSIEALVRRHELYFQQMASHLIELKYVSNVVLNYLPTGK